MDKEKINQYLNKHQQARKVFEQDYFKLAICHVLLENYEVAKGLFEKAIVAMLSPDPFWKASAQPNWLVDIFLLSGRPDLYPSILEELDLIRISSTNSHPVGNSFLAQYCYSVMEILYPGIGNISEWIKNLLKRPKVKDMYAIGQCLQAIMNMDQISFD